MLPQIMRLAFLVMFDVKSMRAGRWLGKPLNTRICGLKTSAKPLNTRICGLKISAFVSDEQLQGKEAQSLQGVFAEQKRTRGLPEVLDVIGDGHEFKRVLQSVAINVRLGRRAPVHI